VPRRRVRHHYTKDVWWVSGVDRHRDLNGAIESRGDNPGCGGGTIRPPDGLAWITVEFQSEGRVLGHDRQDYANQNTAHVVAADLGLLRWSALPLRELAALRIVPARVGAQVRASDACGSRPVKAARRSQAAAPGGGGTSAPNGDPGATMSRYSGLIMARAPSSPGELAGVLMRSPDPTRGGLPMLTLGYQPSLDAVACQNGPMSWDEGFASRYEEMSAHMTADITFYVELARQADGPLVELAVGNGCWFSACNRSFSARRR